MYRIILAFASLLMFALLTINPEPLAAQSPPPIKCDANGDGNITRADLSLIRASIGYPVTGPDDPRDANNDGIITINDVRACTQRCTFAACAES